jgi:hypothetical protein
MRARARCGFPAREDLKRRGLDVPPRLAIADGALGFWKAAGEVWPKTREGAQKSWRRLGQTTDRQPTTAAA